jgi:hypothetical protein
LLNDETFDPRTWFLCRVPRWNAILQICTAPCTMAMVGNETIKQAVMAGSA